MDRRQFIKGSSCACLLMGASSITSCIHYTTLHYEKENNVIRVRKSDLMQSKWVIVKPTQSYHPIFLQRTENEKYTAVLMVCTHMQCEVKPTGSLFNCPCHGAEFNLSGKVQKGPATHNLLTYPTTTDENYIYIQIIPTE
jgi:cytochrome b6-f complex iron-sulfur subunit